LFLVQLALNALWSWLFFGWHRGGLAFADILVLLNAVETWAVPDGRELACSLPRAGGPAVRAGVRGGAAPARGAPWRTGYHGRSRRQPARDRVPRRRDEHASRIEHATRELGRQFLASRTHWTGWWVSRLRARRFRPPAAARPRRRDARLRVSTKPSAAESSIAAKARDRGRARPALHAHVPADFSFAAAPRSAILR
jgi:hypothetical protein